MKRKWEITLGILLPLLVFVILPAIILFLLINSSLDKEIACLMQEIKDRHETLQELIPKPIRDEDNCATFYTRAFASFSWETNEEEEQDAFYGVLKEGWLKEHEEKMLALLKRNSDALSLIREGAKRKECRFDLDYNAGAAMLLPHLAQARAAARMIKLEGLYKAGQGDIEGAFECYLTGMKLGRDVGLDPLLISKLVEIAIISISNSGFRHSLDKWNLGADGYLKTIQKIQSIETSRLNFSEAMKMERAFGLKIFDDFGSRAPSMLMGPTSGPGLTWYDIKERARTIYYLIPLVGKMDRVSYLRWMKQIIDLSDKPYYEVSEEVKALESEIIKTRFPCLVTKMMTPALGKSLLAVQARYEAECRSLILAFALKAYKAQHGEYPEKLAELSPQILKELPLDPFTGKEFLYVQKDEGFVVYSTGEDGEDDGGTIAFVDTGARYEEADMGFRCQQ